jgi:hypothetical protein
MPTKTRTSFILYAEDVAFALDGNDFAYDTSPMKGDLGMRFDVSVKAGNAVILCYKTARAVLQGAKSPKLSRLLTEQENIRLTGHPGGLFG